MYNIVLYVNTLNESAYKLYMQLYSSGLINYPMIYTNKCAISTHMNIPIFYSKYIFNQHYNIIISDESSHTENIVNMCDKLVILKDNDSIDDIIQKIQETTKC